MFLIVAFVLMIIFDQEYSGSSWKVTFFLAAHVISAVLIIPVFVLHMLKWTAFTLVFLIEKKLGKSKWNAIVRKMFSFVVVV